MKLQLTPYEKRNYVLKDKEDLKILAKIKKLEKMKITDADREIILLIRTQLKDDWRTPLINYLNKMMRRYR